MRKRSFCYSVFRAEGLNRERLLNLLRRRGIALSRVRYIDAKTTEFSIPAKEEENFFAITANLCYNVKKIGERGIFAPAVRLLRSTGVLIGAVLFVALVCLADGAVLSVDYYGSGAVYKDRAQAVLENCGITPFSVVDGIALEKAETEILKREPAFSFASIRKRGTRLKVNLVLSPEASGIVDTERKELVSPVAGVVESVTVLRGTALVQAGDAVEAGDVLIGGYNEIKDTVYETYVLGSVSILAEKKVQYVGGENAEEEAKAFAQAQTDFEIVGEDVYKEPAGEEFIYTVTVRYRVKVK